MKAMLNSKVATIELYFCISKISLLLSIKRLRLPALRKFLNRCKEPVQIVKMNKLAHVKKALQQFANKAEPFHSNVACFKEKSQLPALPPLVKDLDT